MDNTLVRLLERRADQTPGSVGYSFRTEGALFLQPDTPAEVSLTYRELRDRAAGIASVLSEIGAPGTPAMLLHPAGLDFVTALFGCFYAGWVPVPISPPFRAREAAAAMLRGIERRSGARVVLSTAPIWEYARGSFSPGLQVVLTERLLPSHADPVWAGDRDSPAFIQFTSGSTSDPKGVVVSHGNILDHGAAIDERLGDDRTKPFVTWMPHFHDGGLIQGVLQPLCRGVPSVLVAPESFLAKPVRWLRAVADAGAVLSGGPNFGYELCIRRTTPAERVGLDLTSWTVAANAGEPIRTSTLERFVDIFSDYGFAPRAHAPAYGLAEATLLVSFHATPTEPRVLALDFESLREGAVVPAGPADNGRAVDVVGCGRPLAGVQVEIVDPDTHEALPEGVVGEIWVAGPTVTQGYWHDEAGSAALFELRIAGEAGRFLRTGDLGFLLDGELFPTGRIKDVIIIRGRNLYPQDVELIAESSHPTLRSGCSAAFGFEDDSGERVGLLMEVGDPTADLASVVSSVRRSIAGFIGVQPGSVTLIGRGEIPKTSSGKIRRRASRSLVLAGGSTSLVSWTDRETSRAM